MSSAAESIFALAARNLLRNRRRSLTTVFAIIVGALSVLMFGGYIRNITYGLQTDYVKYGGHFEIQRQGYHLHGGGDPAAYGISRYREVIAAIQRDPVLAPMLVVATPTLQLGGIAGNFGAGVSRTVFGRGVVVADQNRMRDWNDYRFPVRIPPLALTGSGPDAAIIGTGVARVLKLCGPLQVADCREPKAADSRQAGARLPGDIASLAEGEGQAVAAKAGPGGGTRIELLATSASGAPNVAALNVLKAEAQPIKEMDDVYVGLHLAQAQRLVYGGDAPRATSIMIQLHHTRQMPAAKARLEQLLAANFQDEPLEVLTFEELNPFYGQAQAMFATILGFIAILIAAIVLFTVTNTMSMAVVERTVEIGTLRALGLRRRGIRRLFMAEGLLLGIIGAVCGVLLAAGLSELINASGLTWTPPGRSPVPLIVRVWGETPLIVGTAIGLALVAVLSAWWPAKRAARLAIVDALRHA